MLADGAGCSLQGRIFILTKERLEERGLRLEVGRPIHSFSFIARTRFSICFGVALSLGAVRGHEAEHLLLQLRIHFVGNGDNVKK